MLERSQYSRFHQDQEVLHFVALYLWSWRKVLKVEGVCVLLVTGHGRYHALDARCGHRGGPLEEGWAKWWHELMGWMGRVKRLTGLWSWLHLGRSGYCLHSLFKFKLYIMFLWVLTTAWLQLFGGDLEDLAEGVSVRCPWHGRRYRVDTGCEALNLPVSLTWRVLMFMSGFCDEKFISRLVSRLQRRSSRVGKSLHRQHSAVTVCVLTTARWWSRCHGETIALRLTGMFDDVLVWCLFKSLFTFECAQFI